MVLVVFGKHSGALCFLGSYRMRPRFAETESCGGLLGGEFGRGFDNRAEWIAHQTGILTVRVVDAP